MKVNGNINWHICFYTAIAINEIQNLRILFQIVLKKILQLYF